MGEGIYSASYFMDALIQSFKDEETLPPLRQAVHSAKGYGEADFPIAA